MADDTTESLSRRRLLRTGGATLVAMTASAASASAASSGDCVVTTDLTDVYQKACPFEDKIDEVDPDVDGYVEDVCTIYYEEWYYVDWGADPYVNGWVSAQDVKGCDA